MTLQNFRIGMNETLTIDFSLSQIRIVKGEGEKQQIRFYSLSENELSILIYWKDRSLTQLRKTALIITKEHNHGNKTITAKEVRPSNQEKKETTIKLQEVFKKPIHDIK